VHGQFENPERRVRGLEIIVRIKHGMNKSEKEPDKES
jgi:hypothetical protein